MNYNIVLFILKKSALNYDYNKIFPFTQFNHDDFEV